MLEPVDINTVWGQIEPEARKLLADADSIRRDCVEGHAICFRCDDGFLIMRVKIDPKTDRRKLHLLWGSAVVDQKGAFERILPEVMKCAKALRCACVCFDTTILGWLRLAPRFGFELRNMEFCLPMEGMG